MRGAKQKIFVDVGQRFGKLVVQSTDARVGVTPTKPAGWRAAVCLCDCGNTTTVPLSRLVKMKAKSCGCWKREAPYKHGLEAHPLRKTHVGMIGRCYDAESVAFPWYGGRGITVHERWHDLATFVADIEADIGPRPEGRYLSGTPLYSLDRIDPDGNYEPGNLRWATAKEQRANRSREHAYLRTFVLLCEWCGHEIPADRNANARYCSPQCRGKATRARKREHLV